MSSSNREKISPFLTFNRDQWAGLRKSVPLKLTEQDLKPLLAFNEDLSLSEVKMVYLPLARLINYYIQENLHRHSVLAKFLDINHQSAKKTTYIISVAGSVAVGKSTSSRILQALLSNWPAARNVDLITTDGFLYPLSKLKQNNLLDKKGFPISYDIRKLITFVSDIKSGKHNVRAPIYSHITYDIIPDQYNIINQPDILILEGLNMLQSGMNYPSDPHSVFASDFVDFSIFVDAKESLLKKWYISRFLKFRKSAFTQPDSYFKEYANLTEQQAIAIAEKIWCNINAVNLKENILPSRERANLILTKGKDHTVQQIRLRK